MGRGPHREPLHHRLRARLPHDDGDRRDQGRQGHGPARPCARRPRRLRRLRRPDANGRRASSTSSPAPTTSRSPMCAVDGVYTNKAPGGVAYRCSFRVTEAAYCIERAMDILAQKLGMDPAELRHEELHPARAVPLPVGARLGIRFRRLSHRHEEGDGRGRLQQAARRAEGEAGGLQARRDARADGHRRRLLHRDRRRRARRATATSSASPCSIRPRSASIRPARCIARIGTKSQGQGHETTYAQIIATELGLAGRRHHGRGGQYRHRALRPRHLRLALDAGLRRRHRHGRRARSGPRRR